MIKGETETKTQGGLILVEKTKKSKKKKKGK